MKLAGILQMKEKKIKKKEKNTGGKLTPVS